MSLKQAEETLSSAQTLLEKLGGERGRWDAMATSLNADLGAIAGNALLSAGFVTYLADEQEAFRAQVHLPTSPHISPVSPPYLPHISPVSPLPR